MKKKRYITPSLVMVEFIEEGLIAQSLIGGTTGLEDFDGLGGSNLENGPISAGVKYQGVMDTDLW